MVDAGRDRLSPGVKAGTLCPLMPFSYTNAKGQLYYLHGKTVTLQNGRPQTIYYFAREPKSEVLEALPTGYRIEENPRTGLPYLKKA